MQSSPSPYTGDQVPSPALSRPQGISRSSGSSPYWASASSASPAQGFEDDMASPAHSPASLRFQPVATPAATDALSTEDASSIAYEEQWASPTEVLELQSVCRQLAQQYQTEMQKMQAELERARRERDACRQAAESTAPLQKAYAASKKSYEAYKKGDRDWQEEREMMRLQLQKLSVENQKLRLSLEKHKRATTMAGVAAASMASASVAGGGVVDTLPSHPRFSSTSTGTANIAAPWSEATPLLSSAFRGTDAHHYTHTTTTTQPQQQQKLVTARGMPAMATSAEAAQYRGGMLANRRGSSTALTPGSSSDAKSGDRVSGSGSLFLDTPPRGASAAVAAGAAGGRAAADASREPTSHDGFSLITPTLSASIPSDEPFTSGLLARTDTPSVPDVADAVERRRREQGEPPLVTSSPPPQPGLTNLGAQETTMPPIPSQSDSHLSRGSGGAAAIAQGVMHSARDGEQDLSGGGAPFSTSAIPTPSSSQSHAEDRRSASTNPIYAQGVSSSSSTGSTSVLAGHDLFPSPRAFRATGAFGFDTTAVPLAMASQDTGKPLLRATAGSLCEPNTIGSALPGTTPTATTTSTSSTSSGLALLYRLPRGPAEALEEQVKLVEAFNALTQRNAELETQKQHMEAMWELRASQRDQRLLATTHEKERALREAQHWADAAATLETRLASLVEQLEDSRVAFESTQQELLETRDAMHVLKATHEAEKQALRAQLEETHAEALQRAKQTYEEGVAAAERAHTAALAEADRVQRHAEDVEAKLSAELQATHDALDKATHALRGHADAESARARATEAALQHAHDQRTALEESLAKAVRHRAVAEAHVEELASEVEHLRAMHKTREDCMQTMEARLEQACHSLAANGSAEEALALWQTRAKSVEEELVSQRTFYERELRVRQTALEALQNHHQQESLKLAKKLEHTSTRYEALKLKFTAAARDKGWLQDITTATNNNTNNGRQRDEKSKLNRKDTTSTSDGVIADAEFEHVPQTDAVERGTGGCGGLQCDPVEMLQTSNKTMSQLCRSLHRPLT